jgi:hypothetical protein
MDRFSETYPTIRNIDRDEDGYPGELVAVLECQNCRASSERLTQSPLDDDFRVCDDCMEEIVAVMARELAEQPLTAELTDRDTAETLALLARAGCTRAEAAVWMNLIEERVA